MSTSTRYDDLVSRNWAFIPSDIQQRMRNSRILLAGCGLGCNIARDLAAMGFGKFIAIDGDVVEASNLNRQAYHGQYIGWKKAEATADTIHSINPGAEIEIVNEYIEDLGQIRSLIEQSDFVLNTVDYHTPVFLTLTDYAQELGKTVFFPTNIGYGAIVMVFDSNSLSMSDYLKVDKGAKCDLSLFLKRIAQDYLPDNLVPLYEQVLDGTGKWASVPQIMPGASLVSALVSTMVVKILCGQKINVAPDFYTLDTWGGRSYYESQD